MDLTREQILIGRLKKKLSNKYLGDDCARLAGETLVTCDTLVDGTHFISSKIRLQDLGWKAMSVNLSDIAAMAGRPRYALVALTLPPGFNEDSVETLYDGITECASAYRTTVVGGDITTGPVLTITVTLLGDVHENGCLTRMGAREGDAVLVTGDFGASMAGLRIVESESKAKLKSSMEKIDQNFNLKESESCLSKHLRPLPRLSESWELVKQSGERGALMDASDGLADALVQIATASDVGLTIDLNQVPIRQETKSVALKCKENYIDWALYGGEDFELVGCLPDKVWQNWQTSVGAALVPFKKIGQVGKSKGISLTFGKEAGPTIELSRTFQHIRDNL
jgi:thiamine-monophosphate kinase